MQSVRFSEFGDPADVLSVEDVQQPEPGANQVLVRLRARSINPSDLLTVRGLYGALPRLPATPGLEGMGEVAAVGEGVKGLRPGQRVIPLGVQAHGRNMFWPRRLNSSPSPTASATRRRRSSSSIL